MPLVVGDDVVAAAGVELQQVVSALAGVAGNRVKAQFTRVVLNCVHQPRAQAEMPVFRLNPELPGVGDPRLVRPLDKLLSVRDQQRRADNAAVCEGHIAMVALNALARDFDGLVYGCVVETHGGKPLVRAVDEQGQLIK